MTSLATGLNTTFPATMCAVQGRAYLTNDFDAMKVWDGIDSSARDAGITGPAAAPGTALNAGGSTDAGLHLVRYRYRNSKSLYVSNPSPSAQVTVTAGNQIIALTTVASTDPKVDQIIVECTAVNSTSYYRTGTVANGTSATINMADTTLVQQTSVSATTGDYEHDKPPLASLAVAHRGRMFVGGATTRTASFGMNSGSTSVTGTGFSPNWAGRQLRIGSEAVSYEIASATTTTITLSLPYSGTTGPKSGTVYSRTPNRIWWSAPLYPEGFRTASNARDCLQGRSDTLNAMTAYGGDLWLFGRHSSDRLVFTSDPGVDEGQLVPVPGDRGVFNQACLVEADGTLYAWDRAGVYQVNSSGAQHISKPLDALLSSLVDYSYYQSFHGIYDPIDRVLMWFFVRDGDTAPKYAVCIERDTGRCWIGQWMQGITSSALVPDSEGQVRVMLGDENGYTWFYGYENSFDGVQMTATTATTAQTGATVTVIPVNDAMTVSPSLAGAMCYIPSTGESRLIASNTASAITLATGLSSAPAINTEVWVGTIPWEYKTKWYVGRGQQFSRKPIYLLLKMHPATSTGKMRVYIYQDFQTSPVTLTQFSTDTLPDGCAINLAGNYLEIDLDGGAGEGYVPVPMPSDWVRALQVRITADKPDGVLRILGMDFSENATGEPDTE
jgi:hypothetical protein